jgi:hypothetical protein
MVVRDVYRRFAPKAFGTEAERPIYKRRGFSPLLVESITVDLITLSFTELEQILLW